MNRADTLTIYEGEKLIIMAMEDVRYLGWHEDENGEIVDEIDKNQVEISYREDDEEGWGVGSSEFVTTMDIKNMADCIRNVIYFKEASAEYSCQNDLFRLAISYDAKAETFSFTAALIETLTWDYHITITKDNLSRSALDEYIQPFFEWEREFPIVDDKR